MYTRLLERLLECVSKVINASKTHTIKHHYNKQAIQNFLKQFLSECASLKILGLLYVVQAFVGVVNQLASRSAHVLQISLAASALLY